MSYKKILQQRARKNQAAKLLTQFSSHDVIKRPISSEQAVTDSSLKNTYHFMVAMGASKIDVKLAIEDLYDVEVLQVRTAILPHKGRANRLTVRKPYKKAMITLKEGDTIVFGD